MASIIRTDCPLGVYTLISDGNNKVTFKVKSNNGGRLAFGSSLPAPTAVHYADCDGNDVFELGDLGSTKLYYMPNGTPQSIAVFIP